jgi:hypothetical protein
MSAAAYFSIIGGGRLIWLVFAHVVLASANIVLGLWWGVSFGSLGVIAAYAVALVVASALNLAGHQRDFGYALLPLSARDAALGLTVTGVVLLATFVQMHWTSASMKCLANVIFSMGLAAFGVWAIRDKVIRLWQTKEIHAEHASATNQ